MGDILNAAQVIPVPPDPPLPIPEAPSSPLPQIPKQDHVIISPMQFSKTSKKGKGGILIGLFVVVLTLPLIAYYVRQPKQIADVRSQAKGGGGCESCNPSITGPVAPELVSPGKATTPSAVNSANGETVYTANGKCLNSKYSARSDSDTCLSYETLYYYYTDPALPYGDVTLSWYSEDSTTTPAGCTNWKYSKGCDCDQCQAYSGVTYNSYNFGKSEATCWNDCKGAGGNHAGHFIVSAGSSPSTMQPVGPITSSGGGYNNRAMGHVTIPKSQLSITGKTYWKVTAVSDGWEGHGVGLTTDSGIWSFKIACDNCSSAPTPTPTITPTPTPAGPQCQNIKVYKNNSVVDPSTLKPGDDVVIAIVGANATKGRIRINNGDWVESDTKNSSNEYTATFTIPSGPLSFTVEAEVFQDGVWQ